MKTTNDRRLPSMARFWFLTLVLLIGPWLAAQDELPQHEPTAVETVAAALSDGSVPTDEMVDDLTSELGEYRGEKAWFDAGRALGAGLGSFLSIPFAGERLRERANDLERLADFLRVLKPTFEAGGFYGSFHEIAQEAKTVLEERQNRGEISGDFLKALRSVPARPRGRAERMAALDGLIDTLSREEAALRQAEDARSVDPDPKDVVVEEYRPIPPPPPPPNHALPGQGGHDQGEPTVGNHPRVPGIWRLQITLIIVLLIALVIALALFTDWKPFAWLRSVATRRHDRQDTSRRGKIDRPESFGGTTESGQDGAGEDELDQLRNDLIERIRLAETRLGSTEAAFRELKAAFDRRLDTERPTSIASPAAEPVSAASAGEIATLRGALESVRERTEALERSARVPAAPDLGPRLAAAEEKAALLEAELDCLAQRGPRIWEVERKALGMLCSRARDEVKVMPLLGPLLRRDSDWQARVDRICNALPVSLDGELADRARLLIDPIKRADLVVAKLKFAGEFLEGWKPTIAESDEELTRTLFLVRDLWFHLLKLLHTEEGRRWRELRLEDWIRTSFRGLADEIYRAHWSRRLARRRDDLSEARGLVDEILSWADLEVIPTEPGTAFDSRHHIGSSTASRPELGEGAIAGVVRVGFRDTAAAQVIQKPEVVVNRR